MPSLLCCKFKTELKGLSLTVVTNCDRRWSVSVWTWLSLTVAEHKLIWGRGLTSHTCTVCARKLKLLNTGTTVRCMAEPPYMYKGSLELWFWDTLYGYYISPSVCVCVEPPPRFVDCKQRLTWASCTKLIIGVWCRTWHWAQGYHGF